MIESKNFVLKWEKFSSNLLESVREQKCIEDLKDVTLVSSDNHHVKAHKIILCAGSEVMKNIILNNPRTMPLIYLRGIGHNVLLSILEFMYYGQTLVNQDFFKDFMAVSIELKIKGLTIFKSEISDELNVEKNSNDQEIEQQHQKLQVTSTPQEENHVNKNVVHAVENHENEYEGNEIMETVVEECNDDDLLNDGKSDSTSDMLNLFASNEEISNHDTNDDAKSKVVEFIDKSMSGNEASILACKTCDFVTNDRKKYTRHKYYKHKPITYAYCKECRFKSKYMSAVKAHARAMHQGEIYQCQFCDLKTSRKGNLQRHEIRAHGDKS